MTKDQFQRISASSSKEAVSHFVCDEADKFLSSEHPDSIPHVLAVVLSVETFFGAVCDGGFTTWFDWDRGSLAHRCPRALREVGLPDYADLAERAIRVHYAGPLPLAIAEWNPLLERIRQNQIDFDYEDDYGPLETVLFELYHAKPTEFRDCLFDYIVRHEQDLVQHTTVAS